nr:hypothetical protein [Paenibacillus sp. NAIST15-1]
MSTIKVVDSIMGSGKTSAAINLMNYDHENNYIFITPYLSEIERVKKACTRRFYDPKITTVDGEKHTKFDSLHYLLINNKNIASTHALFKRANEETKDLIHSGNYILILDEVMNVIEQLELKQGDIDLLFKQKLIYEKDGYIHWNESQKDYDSRYNDIRDMALNKNLIIHKGKILIWTFPIEVFKAFKEVYILTYLFDAQIQKYYYDMNNVKYEKYEAVEDRGFNYYTFRAKTDNTYEEQIKKEIKSKITIYQGTLNNIGDPDYSLSKSWYTNKKDLLPKLKNNTENYFKNKVKAKSNQVMWTTFKQFQSKIKGRGYAKSFVPCNARATNEFKDRIHIAYTINYFLNPIIEGFFNDKNVKINEDLYSVSDLLQWVWRSGIREGNSITIYIPSKRMRGLLKQWLDNEL